MWRSLDALYVCLGLISPWDKKVVLDMGKSSHLYFLLNCFLTEGKGYLCYLVQSNKVIGSSYAD
ncbi:hypothetical protein RchiOBHm_Chr2g0119931 [Rosa chinensis]|uniref:Uncharacterized protein n=1 Tax=Rosa chinensis TaxID=74649 RepID=A0A2P6RS48_ROSCH|nr:hypothetical protein RchiOBHm_Chr2g0119931 [Rosa chinensis]